MQPSMRSRLAACLVAASLALVSLTASLTIADKTTHECTGDACPLCHIVASGHAALALAASTGASALGHEASASPLAHLDEPSSHAEACWSLIHQKTRLDI